MILACVKLTSHGQHSALSNLDSRGDILDLGRVLDVLVPFIHILVLEALVLVNQFVLEHLQMLELSVE